MGIKRLRNGPISAMPSKILIFTLVASEKEAQLDLIRALRIGGLKIHYAQACPRKLWLFCRQVRMEKYHQAVKEGRILHQTSYKRHQVQDLLLEDLLRIDLVTGQKIVEVKRSSRRAAWARLQLGYYLYFLELIGITGITGEIRYPAERRREEVQLTPELRIQVRALIQKVAEIEALPHPPPLSYKPLCKNCAFSDLCWA